MQPARNREILSQPSRNETQGGSVLGSRPACTSWWCPPVDYRGGCPGAPSWGWDCAGPWPSAAPEPQSSGFCVDDGGHGYSEGAHRAENAGSLSAAGPRLPGRGWYSDIGRASQESSMRGSTSFCRSALRGLGQKARGSTASGRDLVRGDRGVSRGVGSTVCFRYGRGWRRGSPRCPPVPIEVWRDRHGVRLRPGCF